MKEINVKKDALVFDGDTCVGNALGFLLKFKGEERKIKDITIFNFMRINAVHSILG